MKHLKLRSLLPSFLIEAEGVAAPAQSAPAPASSPDPSSGVDGSEYNIGIDFTNFEKTIAAHTENAKNLFQTKLLSLINGKRILLRGSKGYGQPIKDYTINVRSASVDYYYDRYVVILKDDDEKEYFLAPGFKLKIMGPAVAPQPKQKKKNIDPLAGIQSKDASKPQQPAQNPSQPTEQPVAPPTGQPESPVK